MKKVEVAEGMKVKRVSPFIPMEGSHPPRIGIIVSNEVQKRGHTTYAQVRFNDRPHKVEEVSICLIQPYDSNQ